MLFKIDQWLLGLFERNSNALTRLTGKNNYFWARVVLFLSTVMVFFAVNNSDYEKFSLIFIVSFSASIIEIYWLERIALSKISPNIANPLKIGDFACLRIVAGLLLLLTLFMALVEMSSTNRLDDPILTCGLWLFLCSLWVFLYLVSCDCDAAVSAISPESEQTERK
ncbi:MAG: hypothetical protein WC668_04085 [Patescibacteria group bacterium]|jgi:hypothetical protein